MLALTALPHSRPRPSAPAVPRSNFANHNKLKRQAMKVIAAAMPADEIAGLAEMFKSIDADGSGTITAEELRDALKARGAGASGGRACGLGRAPQPWLPLAAHLLPPPPPRPPPRPCHRTRAA